MKILPADHAEQKYLNQEQQSQYSLAFSEEDSTFFDAEGNWLEGRYNFIITCEENPMIVCHKNLNHSFLARGKKVLAAGELVFDEYSLLTKLTNNSGHYRPLDDEMLSIIKALYIASGGKLTSYTSHCSNTLPTYPVIELLETDSFSSVSPLNNNELIDNDGYRALASDGYGEFEAPASGQSYHRKLPQEYIRRYQEIIQLNGFFTSADMPDSSNNTALRTSGTQPKQAL